ncbi:hypothetical protein ACFV0G_36995, partial [Kitasatospora sp. NPDC059571]
MTEAQQPNEDATVRLGRTPLPQQPAPPVEPESTVRLGPVKPAAPEATVRLGGPPAPVGPDPESTVRLGSPPGPDATVQ